MENQVYVGVDVSKERLDVALRPSGELFSETNDEGGIERIIARLKRLGCARIVVEATGGYETLLATALYNAELPVVVANPRQVRDYARGLGKLAKSDAIDARVLATYAERPELEVRRLPDAETLKLRELCTRRDQLTAMIAAERNHLEHASKAGQKAINSHISYLKKQLRKVARDIDQMIRGSGLWHDLNELLDTAPGMGPGGRSTVLARLTELGELNRREAASLVGAAPFNQDSGKFRGARRISGGRFSLRRALYMCTLTAVRIDPGMRAFYQRLRERGKPVKVALIAALRRYVIILNQMVKTKTPWRTAGCQSNA